MLQPQYDMSHRLRGFEALARMLDEDGTIIPPVEFIPVAEKVGLIDRIDSVVFKKAAEFVGELVTQRSLDITLSINISVRHLIKKDFTQEIKDQLAKSRLPANRLEIDKTFIDRLNSSEKSKQYVAAIISLGHIMGYKVISEGVEENDQLEVLKQIGCDFVQGYIWGKPLLARDVEILVSEM